MKLADGVLRERLADAMAGIHRPTTRYQGLTEAGEAHLLLGGEIGPDGMPMDVGMKTSTVCICCGSSQRYPCDTLLLLIEAGVIIPTTKEDQ